MTQHERTGVDLRELSDGQLQKLHRDMIQLAQSGPQRQQMEADWLLPLCGEEMQRRYRLNLVSLERERWDDATKRSIGRRRSRIRPGGLQLSH